MSTSENRIEALLLHDGFVRALARSLLTDRASADDVAQEAWLAALERGGQADSIPRWLAGVVKNLSLKRRRGEERRARRERDSARPEATPSAEEILEREAARARVVEAVLALEEPYREAVLLRYFENLPPRALARRQGCPVETVRTRLKRALEMLRARLDCEYGERGAWSALLLPFAEGPLPAPVGPLAKSIPLVLSGLTVMSIQAKLAAAAGVVLILFLFLGGRGSPVLSRADEPSPAPQVALQVPVAEAPPELNAVAPSSERAPLPVQESSLPSAGPDLGSVRVRVSWFDGGPAEAIRVLVEPNWKVEGPSLRARDGLTDEHGELALDQLEPGRAFVRLDRGPADDAEITAGSVAEVELTLPRGFDVTGFVRDPSGGPVAGAEVWFARELQLENGLVLARTDREGRFRLRSLPTGYIGARARGFAPSLLQTMMAGEGAELALELVLMGPGGAVEGTVLDPDGRPLANAWVGIGLDPPKGLVHMTPVGGERAITGSLAGPIEARTDAEGRYCIEGLAPGLRRMAVRALGFGAWRGEVEVVEQRRRKQDVRLLPGVSLVGRILDAEGAPADASVRVGADSGVLRSATATDEEGRFRLDDLEPGEFVVRAWDWRNGEVEAKLRGAPGETLTWEASLVKGGSIRGRVLDEAGQPLVGWRLMALDPPVDGAMEADFAETDSAGSFVFHDVEECPHRIEVRSPDCATIAVAVATGVYPGSEELVLRVESGQRPSSRVLGRVVDDLGQPVVGALLVLGRPRLGGVGPFYSDSSGGFELGPVPPGAWILMVYSLEHADRPAVVLGPRELAPDELWNCGAIVLTRGGTVLVTAAGTELPPEGTPEFLVLREGVPANALEREGDAWRSGPLQAGAYRLQVRGRGIAAKQLPFEIRTDEVTRLEVPLDRGVPVQIRLRAATTDEGVQPELHITDSHDELVLAADVSLWQDEEGNAHAGDWRTEVSLAPGHYRVDARLEAGPRATAELRVDPGEPAALPLELR